MLAGNVSGASGSGVGFLFELEHNPDGFFVLDDFGMTFCKIFGVFIDAIVAGGNVDGGENGFVGDVIGEAESGDRFAARSEVDL